MPWLPIYAAEPDFDWLFDILSTEPEIAFLVPDGSKRWIAKKSIGYTSDCRVGLWHIPSGPLPLLRKNGGVVSLIQDPWSGWTEERTGANTSTPYFGAGHPGVIWLNAHARGKKAHSIGLSSFEWIGNHYRLSGSPAAETTERFWKKLGRVVRKQSIRVPRAGPWDGPHPEIWGLPEALKQFVMGHDRDPNP